MDHLLLLGTQMIKFFTFGYQRFEYKNKISKYLTVASPYFSYVNRCTNILHIRLRQNCALNIDFHRWNIISSSLCSCGKIEDAHRFFFSCP